MPTSNPKWWTDNHTSKWERAKEALKRDWEQTKHDLGSKKAPDLDQSAGDTVRQAVGKQPIPGSMDAGRIDRWDDAEPGLRYGWAARSQYRDHNDWDDRLESKLKEEWNDLRTGRTWDEAKRAVRRGWESAKN
jgi:hypothetical protein